MSKASALELNFFTAVLKKTAVKKVSLLGKTYKSTVLLYDCLCIL
jgi:hypothetical protein